MKKLRVMVFGTLCAVLFFALLGQLRNDVKMRFAFAADEYYQEVMWTDVCQYNATLGAWVQVYNFTANGTSTRILADIPTSFEVCLRLRQELYSSQSQAESYSRSNISIVNGAVYTWDRVLLNNSARATTSDALYYYVYKVGNWTGEETLPEEGVTYDCVSYGQAYY